MAVWGQKPSGLVKVSENKTVDTGDIYGAQIRIRLPQPIGMILEGFDWLMLERIKNSLISRGDKPLYIQVDVDQHWTSADLYIEYYAVKGTDPIAISALVRIILNILAAFGIEHILEWVAYFWKPKREPTSPEEPGTTTGKETAGVSLLTILIILLILYYVSKKRGGS